MKKRLVSILCTYNTSVHVAYAVQFVIMTSIALMQAVGLRLIHNALQAKMFYNNLRVMFELIGSIEQGYASQSQRKCHAVGDFVAPLGVAGDSVGQPESVER